MDFQNFGASKLHVNYTMRRLPNIIAVLRIQHQLEKLHIVIENTTITVTVT
jgi:hypothetical protein